MGSWPVTNKAIKQFNYLLVLVPAAPRKNTCTKINIRDENTVFVRWYCTPQGRIDISSMQILWNNKNLNYKLAEELWVHLHRIHWRPFKDLHRSWIPDKDSETKFASQWDTDMTSYIHSCNPALNGLTSPSCHVPHLYGRDITAAIIEPITTIVSLSPNLFLPCVRLRLSATTDFPALSSDWQPLWWLWSLPVSDMRGSRATLLPSPPPSELVRILTTDHHLCSNIQKKCLQDWK